MQYENIFKPITINQVTVKNRIMSTGHAEVYAVDGYTQEKFIRYYEEKAKGGIGMFVFGGTSHVSKDSPWSWWKSIKMWDDATVEHLDNFSTRIHKHGCKLMVQITHMGRRSNYFGGDWPHLVTPSGIREPVHRGVAKTIEYHEINRIVADFAKAAQRAKDGGLDGVELSAAHQHLLDQFWSPRTNKRTDEYGGSLTNRMRFSMQVLEAIREQVGKDFCVGIRITGDEFHHDGLDHEQMKEIAQILSESKLVDYISVIGSGADTHNTLANCMPPMALPPQPFIKFAAGIREVVNVPVMHAQSIKDPSQAEKVLAAGMVDLVGMTRAHIADPHLVNKIAQNQETQIKQCVGANYCIDRQYMGMDVLCIQNTATSREGFIPHSIDKTKGQIHKVVVVGAGPAGLEMARVAKERGHQVVLFEKSEQVGGQVNIAAKAPQRDQMAGIIRWFDLEIKRLGIDIRLNTTATSEIIKQENPSIVVIATGGTPNVYEHAGWHYDDGMCVSSWDVLNGNVSLPKNVLVFDNHGQQAGSSVAHFAASKGSLVEIVTSEAKVADDVGGTSFPIIYRALFAHNIIMTPSYLLHRVYAEGDKKIAVICNEYTGVEEEREVDMVIIENSTLPADKLYFELKANSCNQGATDIDYLYDFKRQPCLAEQEQAGTGYALFRVGEAVCPRNIHGVLYDSIRLAKDF